MNQRIMLGAIAIGGIVLYALAGVWLAQVSCGPVQAIAHCMWIGGSLAALLRLGQAVHHHLRPSAEEWLAGVLCSSCACALVYALIGTALVFWGGSSAHMIGYQLLAGLACTLPFYATVHGHHMDGIVGLNALTPLIGLGLGTCCACLAEPPMPDFIKGMLWLAAIAMPIALVVVMAGVAFLVERLSSQE